MKKLSVTLALVAATILSLSGCCSVVPDPVKIPVPPPITYPNISAEELACLSDKAYEALAVRDTMCRERVKTLEDIIKSTYEVE